MKQLGNTLTTTLSGGKTSPTPKSTTASREALPSTPAGSNPVNPQSTPTTREEEAGAPRTTSRQPEPRSVPREADAAPVPARANAGTQAVTTRQGNENDKDMIGRHSSDLLAKVRMNQGCSSLSTTEITTSTSRNANETDDSFVGRHIAEIEKQAFPTPNR